MKQILLFGAGKSATVLIDYVIRNAGECQWNLVVVDANLELARSKVNDSAFAEAISFDIADEQQRTRRIRNADIVISMLPPVLHAVVARDCLRYSKHLLTASYVDDETRKMHNDAVDAGVLFLCEMGLDPGIDHMSAMQIIDRVRTNGGKITSFKSHCGGLVAPSSDDNPWHYKISWNPRNIVLAGKAGAHYRENGEEVNVGYAELFTKDHVVEIPGQGYYCWYPNRDSLGYTRLYGLENTETFIRTTLRHPDFMYGWKNLVDLKFTDEIPLYESDDKSLAALFKEHLDKHNFSDWLQKKMSDRFEETKDMLSNLAKLMEAEEEAEQIGESIPDSFLSADDKGNLEEIEIGDIKTKAAAFVANRMHEANLTLKQLMYLGLDDHTTNVNRGLCSAADILQFALEKKLGLASTDRDMIIMLHEFEFMQKKQKKSLTSHLVVEGDDGMRTAMAKTVGLPLGIAAKLILNGQISLTGVHIPTSPKIYEPVLKELELNGIRFVENEKFC